MIAERVRISEGAYLDTYVIEHSEYIQTGTENTWQSQYRPSIIVCPGGGYRYIADSENEPVVFRYLAKGYSCFTLHYSINEASCYPNPLKELFLAIKYVRENAKRYWIRPDAIVVSGFSAGGHLAALAATQYHLEHVMKMLKTDEFLHKPDAVILCYPIIDVARLYNDCPDRLKTWGKMLYPYNQMANVIDYLSDKMCPAFIWHTRTDGIVPCSQSLELIEKMHLSGVDYEAHIFGKGYHGLSTNDVLSNYQGAIMNGDIVPNVEKWVDMSSEWLNYRFEF